MIPIYWRMNEPWLNELRRKRDPQKTNKKAPPAHRQRR
jgi:hypothetical protein